ncbi:hypothetical protein SAMN04488689_10630 [Paenibacillus sp. cl6col]|uniref:Selenocysteine lyase n=2 Tax=Paenibacillus TaxID=44249 RepID=A0ABT4E8S7_PAEAL|nr:MULTISPECIES: hypothetical protein [unclassified Paenibacillus]EPY13684.1 hypothetical protein PAAL66ix_06628 [Paenibacillus alvei A6-6i-x]MCY9530142.1 hypothetical protein [Paenibacillus alvei]SDF63468.1 hypothetical protein SAMN04488689_10630 [Paenibacillus sp. cl6col]
MEKMIAVIFVFFVFMIPMYGVLIWTYFCPEDSLLWGKRWMYKEEPEISNSAIRFAKVSSLTAIVVLTIIFGVLIFS